jgi:hypothetical protein
LLLYPENVPLVIPALTALPKLPACTSVLNVTEDEPSAPVAELPSKAVQCVNTPDPKLEWGRNAAVAPTMITDKIARPLLYLKLCLVFMVLLLVVWCGADLPPNEKS